MVPSWGDGSRDGSRYSTRRYSSRALLGNIKRLQLALYPFVERHLFRREVGFVAVGGIGFRLLLRGPPCSYGAQLKRRVVRRHKVDGPGPDTAPKYVD